MVVMTDYVVNSYGNLTKTTGKMKLSASKKAQPCKGTLSLRDYCDFAKMVFTVPS
jgi:hypothetical protein